MKKTLVALLLAGLILLAGVVYAAGTQKIDVTFQDFKYYFNGVEKQIPAGKSGFVYQGTTYVPLRFVAENLGKEVVWDEKTLAIRIQEPSGAKKYAQNYEDGTYRGIFADRGDIQVSIEFKLKDNKVTEISYRQLFHGGIDYRTEKEDQKIIGIRGQHETLAKYLIGKDIRESLADLYNPGNIVTEQVDTYTGATIRSGKVISAIRDALNRGVYRY